MNKVDELAESILANAHVDRVGYIPEPSHITFLAAVIRAAIDERIKAVVGARLKSLESGLRYEI